MKPFLKNRTRNRTLDLRKNGPPKKRNRWKNWTTIMRFIYERFVYFLLPYERQCWSDSFWHKIRGLQGLVSVPITYEKCTTNFHIDKGEHCRYFILRLIKVTYTKFCWNKLASSTNRNLTTNGQFYLDFAAVRNFCWDASTLSQVSNYDGVALEVEVSQHKSATTPAVR